MVTMPMISNERSNQNSRGDTSVSLTILLTTTEVMVSATKNAVITAIAATIRMPLITYLPYQRNEKINIL
jgi:hypothetical protein